MPHLRVEVVKRKQPTSSENQNDSVAGAEGSHSKRPKHVDDEQDESRRGAHATGAVVRRCPYLDTVNRALLDFDFEKVCSVSSTNVNVYACLTCGKYFQGRGRGSHAYYHSLQADHHVFINLLNEKVYCLPDGYEVQDPSLDDIKFVLHPRYTRELVTKLDSIALPSHALDGSVYYPGVVGLNNIKNNDYINAVVHSLAHVRPLRDFFLLEENYRDCKSHLVHTFGDLIRKMWDPRNFKSHVSPHELIQAVVRASNKRFQIGVSSDPIEFLSWLLNTLHRELGGTRKAGSSIIHQAFQGSVQVTTRPFKPKEDDTQTAARNKPNGAADKDHEDPITVENLPFLYLSIELPPPPLFKGEAEKNVIPQVPLFTILQKFDGQTEQDIAVKNETKQYILTRLPRYLIVHLKRFTKNNWFMEKNPTIVNFPVKNLQMREYTTIKDVGASTKYNLVANLCHEGTFAKGAYKVHLQCRGTEQWYEIQDLMVRETMPQLISLSETYIQIYELIDMPPMPAPTLPPP